MQNLLPLPCCFFLTDFIQLFFADSAHVFSLLILLEARLNLTVVRPLPSFARSLPSFGQFSYT